MRKKQLDKSFYRNKEIMKAEMTQSPSSKLLFSWEESKKENDAKTNCKVVVDDEKRHLGISFDGETHGLIWVNKARKSNKGTCLKCCIL